MHRWHLGALLLVVSLVRPAATNAQVYGPVRQAPEISYGFSLDLASRYVWRGIKLSDETSLQPSAWISLGDLEIGTWGSHSLDDGYREQDFWATLYLGSTPAGVLALTVNDYYISSDFGSDLFDFEGVRACEPGEPAYGRPPRCRGGPHTTEVVASFTSRRTPFDVLVAYNFHNDPEGAVYAQASYRPSVLGFDFAFTGGGTLNESRLRYQADGASLTNLAAGVGRTIVGAPLDIPLAVEIVHNPEIGETYYVARAGVALQR